MSATLLMLVGNLVGLSFTYLMQYLISREPVYNPNTTFTGAGILMLSVVVFSGCVIMTFQGKYKRLEAERSQNEDNEASLLQRDMMPRYSEEAQ